MYQYKSRIPLKFRNFKDEPSYELQFCQTQDDKIKTGKLNEFGIEIFQDSKESNVLYNQTYHTINGMPYHLIGMFSRSGYKLLKVQFQLTHSIGIIRLDDFIKHDTTINVFDPYELRMFNNHACIGNIDYEPLGREEPYLDMKDGIKYYEIWCDLIGRCYDPGHRLYSQYGAYGVMPALFEWHCFKYFYIMFDTTYHYYNIDPDPNLPYYYLFLHQRIGFINAKEMSHFPAPVRAIKRTINNNYNPSQTNKKLLLYRIIKDML